MQIYLAIYVFIYLYVCLLVYLDIYLNVYLFLLASLYLFDYKVIPASVSCCFGGVFVVSRGVNKYIFIYKYKYI